MSSSILLGTRAVPASALTGQLRPRSEAEQPEDRLFAVFSILSKGVQASKDCSEGLSRSRRVNVSREVDATKHHFRENVSVRSMASEDRKCSGFPRPYEGVPHRCAANAASLH